MAEDDPDYPSDRLRADEVDLRDIRFVQRPVPAEHEIVTLQEPTVKHPRLAKIAEGPSKRTKKNRWNLYWLFWLFGMVITGFLIPELHAINNKQQGDTLSENIRLWLHPDTPGGGASWLAVVAFLFTLVFWLWGHIAQWPGWPLTGG